MAMRFHDERDKRLDAMRHFRIHAPPPGSKPFVLRRQGTLPQRPIKRSQRSEVLSRDDGIVDDTLMITLCYEDHLSMQQMLAALAEMRGEDAEVPLTKPTIG
jgi:hypothetical protein